MGKINSRSKGCRGEREFAATLRSYGYEARRGQQFSGSPDSPDVVSNLPFHFEVKRTEKFSVYKAMAQAVRDSEPGKAPIVAHKQNGQEWLVVLRVDDFMRMVKALKFDPRARVVRRIRKVS